MQKSRYLETRSPQKSTKIKSLSLQEAIEKETCVRQRSFFRILLGNMLS